MPSNLNLTLPVIQFTEQTNVCSFVRFTTTRHGGISTGKYDSFNLGYYGGDNPELVQKNRNILCKQLQIDPDLLFVPHQTHGDVIKIIDATFLHNNQEYQESELDGVDALITSLPDVGIAITTADCVPVVFHCPQQAIIAAAHAGWRGTAANIAVKVIKKMQTDYSCEPQNIRATIFPCISSTIYEVGKEVIQAIAATGIDFKDVSRPGNTPGRFFLDLTAVNYRQLLLAGLASQNISLLNDCTYTNNNDLFSARRQGINSGRMLSGIVMK